jgi:serine phosphatase RsbU (regulator of sigma subunit)/Flp pilus assembly protein TadD
MKRIFTLLLVVACLSVSKLWAQRAEADSLLRVAKKATADAQRLPLYNRLSEQFLKLNPDSAQLFADKAVQIAVKQKQPNQHAVALMNRAKAIAKGGNDAAAVSVFRQALAVPRGASNDTIKGNILRELGVVYTHLAYYDSALFELFSALEVFNGKGMEKNRAAIFNNIGNAYYFTKNRKEAIRYYQESLEIQKKLNNQDGMAKQYGNLGLIFVAEKDTAKAIEYSIRSLSYFEKLGNKSSIATSQVNLAHAYSEFKKFDLAFPYARLSLKLRKELGDKKGIALSTIILGAIYMEMKDYEKAIPLLTEGVAMVHNLRLRSYEWEAMKNLAFCYSATGNHKLAALLYPKALEIKDTIYREESSEQIAQMEALYQTQKDGKVKLLEQEAEINELQLRKRATYLAAAAAITFLLGIMSLMAFFAYRSKSKINSILERKNHLIEAQKKEITDSIRYAENIQRALLPHADVLQAVFPDSFLIHRPKDIVSGDFYWIYDFPDRVYFAVVDCTGHGVPGAFMSFIGTSALNRAITDLGLITPSDILSSLSDQVSETLRSGQGADVKDGMDLALCCYFKQTGELHYAGAYNPLWVMRNGEMEIIRANKQPVGNMSSHSPFTNHILNVSAGDAVYLFSDGFADQFGGAHDKRIGSAKFRSTLLAMKTKSLKEQGIALAAYFDAWKGTAEQVDDVCVMGVRF